MSEFKLPIQYVSHQKVDDSIVDSLEFISSNETPIYHKVFSPKTPEAIEAVKMFASHYTTDTTFLKDSVHVNRSKMNKVDTTTFRSYWNEIKENKEFKLTYQYLESPWVSFLNSSPSFLSLISFYFVASPILFFLSPLLILLIPFITIRLTNTTFTWSEYYECVKLMLQKHAIGKLVTQFGKSDPNTRLYLVGTTAFFIFQFYVNIYTLYTFRKNITYVHKVIREAKTYVSQTIHTMNQLQDVIRPFESYRSFSEDVENKKQAMLLVEKRLSTIHPTLWNCGSTRAFFYDLYSNQTIHQVMEYSFGFHGYIQCIQQLTKKVHPCFFSTKTTFQKAFYPTSKPIKNSYSLDKNIILTGPNASGKTTLMKATMINILLSQQIGCGFYKSATIHPYESFYCYINIPDTSGRDSLFQAEARRCKEIIDEVEKKTRTFCIFDELFSGTNPQEATASAGSLIRYLSTFSDFQFLLTTHFIDMCDSLPSTLSLKQMSTDKKYTMINGISRIKGGIKVLQQMNFPESVINGAKCG
jgi:hypothetical protein